MNIFSVVGYYHRMATEFPDQEAFFFSEPSFDRSLTWRQIWEKARANAALLVAEGCLHQERIGILGPSSPQWDLTQLSIFLAGGVVVGIDPHDSLEAYALIIRTCKIKKIFCHNEELLRKVQPLINGHGLIVKTMSVAAMGNAAEDIEIRQPLPSDLATVIFTSGTSFEPKGIEYTHHQLVLAVETVLKAYPQVPLGVRTTCWLPLSNLFQRIINFCSVAKRGEIYFVEQPQEVMKHLQCTNPHVFIGVPRFYEKVYEGIMARIGRSGILKTSFLLASIPARRRCQNLRDGQSNGLILRISCALADALVLRHIRRSFGKNIMFAISGSAPMRRDVLEFFHMIGILVLEAYGTSENIVPISANRIDRYRFGSVGIPLIDDSVFIADDNEILIKGPGVFKGYVGQPAGSGMMGNYFPTGDLGHVDGEGFLYVEGRRSEVFKTTTGKKIAALEIDAVFKKITYVDIALTMGENRKAPVVLITLDFNYLAHHMQMKVEELWDIEDGSFNVRVLERISRDLSDRCVEIPEKMRPVGFLVMTRKFVLENNELTPNLKLRRKHIEKKIQPTLDRLYLEIDTSTRTHYWFLDSRDLKISTPHETAVAAKPSSRLFQVSILFVEVFKTIIAYNIMSRSTTVLNRKLGQIFRNHLGRLRGPLQKVGQMLSYMHEELPEEFREEVRDLLRDSPVVNPFLIRSIVEGELKRPIQSVFSEWRDIPIHTASIGQVHYARLKSGEPVAVKVLLPQMDRIIKADMDILGLCIPLVSRIIKTPSTRGLFDELRTLIQRECDLKAEAYNYRFFGEIFKDTPNVLIPKVFLPFCTTNVLVTSYIEGKTLEQFIKEADNEKRRKIADIIWRFHCASVNQHAVFNADPHPGNYLICGDKVAFLDFGFCKRWDTKFIEVWKKQTLAGCRGDAASFAAATRSMGYFRKGDPAFVNNLLPVYRDTFHVPWLYDRDYKITHQYLKLYLNTIFEKIVLAGGVNIPRQVLASLRLYFEVFSIMAELDVEYNYHRATIPYLENPLHINQDQTQPWMHMLATVV